VTATARRLQKIRAAYGAALVLVPGPVIWLATGQPPSRRACRVAQVLGTRHLIQAALTAAAPEPAVLAIGGQVDAVHAASMLLLAAVSRAGRRAALTEAAFALVSCTRVTRATGGSAQEPTGHS
jgi:type II secretory pathway component PulM